MKLLPLLSLLTIGATVEGFRYHISEQKMTKKQGNDYCNSLGSWLAVMDDENIQNAWTELIKREPRELLFDRRPNHGDKQGMKLVILSADKYKLVPLKRNESAHVLCQAKNADRVVTKKDKKHQKDKKKGKKHQKDKKKAKKHRKDKKKHHKGSKFFN